MRLLLAACAALAVLGRPLADEEIVAAYGHFAAPAAGPTRTLPVPLDAAQSLKDAAAKAGIFIGAAINYGGIHGNSQGPQYPAVAQSQFSLFTAENECKVGPVHPEVDTYAFAQCDALATFTNLNQSAFRLHNLCWDTENPPWLNSLTDPVALKAALQAHIGNMTAHYLGDPSLAYYAVDVVNEAVSDGGDAILKPTTPWYPALKTYVSDAFAAAAAARQPFSRKPLLCYNDYGAEAASSAKAAKVVTLIKQLQGSGLPVDCVGLQMHVSVDAHPSRADVSENIRQLGALGLTVHITEMDVQCSGCNATRLAAQALVYADMLGACLENANCKSFETWGIYDGDTWVGTDNAPLLYDAQWQPKPAYAAVLATLQQHAGRRGRLSL